MLYCLLFGLTAATTRPIIGVLTLPYYNKTTEIGDYIAASYVKYLESGGARVIPIHYNIDPSEIPQVFSRINGILFTGGGTFITSDTTVHKTAKQFYDLAVASNDQGDPFPIWATCLGFQMLMMISSDDSVLCFRCFKSTNMSLPLDFAPNAQYSRLFSNLPSDVFNALGTQPLTANEHTAGILLSTFNESKLSKFYRLVSTNFDSVVNLTYVSTVEAFNYPFYAVQWHPEKSFLEWNSKYAFSHDPNAIYVSQFLAQQFVDETRRSSHKFPDAQSEADALMYNYTPIPDPKGYFNQVYLWRYDLPYANAKKSNEEWDDQQMN
eukprot:c6569_g1_i1.p1 GENE.c6569_g1_i1~~c6569_g1_i1.p1  ORF type:complete len:323 (+),score=63.20 c6569_g1_i1:32-1000(+)